MRLPLIPPAPAVAAGLTSAYVVARFRVPLPAPMLALTPGVRFIVVACFVTAFVAALTWLRALPHLTFMTLVSVAAFAALVKILETSIRGGMFTADARVVALTAVAIALAWPWRTAKAGEPGRFLGAPVAAAAPVAGRHREVPAAAVPAPREPRAAARRRLAALEEQVAQAEHRARSAEHRAAEAEARALARETDLQRLQSTLHDELAQLAPADHAFGGRWELVPDRPAIGAGRFGSVHLVRNLAPLPGEPAYAAMKLLRHEDPDAGAEVAGDESDRLRLLREVDLLSRVDSRHIARILDGGFDRALRRTYLVIPYHAEGSLAGLLARHGRLDVDTAVAWTQDIMRALDALHSVTPAIVHRDVKPANVLVCDGQRGVVLCDFSIARLADLQLRSVTVGMAPHTPFYAAPEQLAGSVDPAVDVHGAAACLYEMLTRAAPYRRELEERGMREYRELLADPSVVPARLDTVRPDVPSDVADLVSRCLSRVPEERPNASDAVGLLSPAAGTVADTRTTLVDVDQETGIHTTWSAR